MIDRTSLPPAGPSFHSLLLLSDSALPLGSFAFSSGLESFLAHTRAQNTNNAGRLQSFDAFLEQSVANVASSALPYVLTVYQNPARLDDLDDHFDASTPCTVARRASVAQGKALATIWERALCASWEPESQVAEAAKQRLNSFMALLKVPSPSTDPFDNVPHAHFPPLFGAVTRALALSVEESAYLFLLNHAKAVLSAAVRSGVMGPYQSQAVLASPRLQTCIHACVKRERNKAAEEANVSMPIMDLWMGRHELLYSRIFNS